MEKGRVREILADLIAKADGIEAALEKSRPELQAAIDNLRQNLTEADAEVEEEPDDEEEEET